MSRKAHVLINDEKVGLLSEEADGYTFAYTSEYVQRPHAQPVSLTLPLRAGPYRSQQIPAFFSGLLAEGALAEAQCRALRIDERDTFGRLLQTCQDTIGAVTIKDCQ